MEKKETKLLKNIRTTQRMSFILQLTDMTKKNSIILIHYSIKLIMTLIINGEIMIKGCNKIRLCCLNNKIINFS